MAAAALKTCPKWITRDIADLPKPDVRSVRWFALYAATQHEGKVAWDLIDRGYQIYLPTYTKTIKPKNSPKPVKVTRVAFPRYVFIGMPARGSWWEVRCVRGVESVVSSNYVPLTLSHEDIEDIMAAEDMGLFSTEEIMLRINEPVTVTNGLFEGHCAVVRKPPKRSTGSVTVELGSLVVKMPLAMVKRQAFA